MLDIAMAGNLFPIYVRNRQANSIIELEINYTVDRACSNVLLSDNTKLVGTPTVTAVVSAQEIQELNLNYPVNDAIKTALNSNGQYFQFV